MEAPLNSASGYTVSVPTQMRYVTQWFKEWSEMQRGDFLPILVEKFTQQPYVNGLVDNMEEKLTTVDRPPSLFQCRAKLFREWINGWSDDDKEKFLHDIETIDGEFFLKYREQLKPVVDETQNNVADEPNNVE